MRIKLKIVLIKLKQMSLKLKEKMLAIKLPDVIRLQLKRIKLRDFKLGRLSLKKIKLGGFDPKQIDFGAFLQKLRGVKHTKPQQSAAEAQSDMKKREHPTKAEDPNPISQNLTEGFLRYKGEGFKRNKSNRFDSGGTKMKSIKSRILLNMLGVIGVSLLVTGVVAVFFSYQGWNKSLELSMTEASKVAAERISAEIVRYQQLMMEAADHPILSGSLVGAAGAGASTEAPTQEAAGQEQEKETLSAVRGFSIGEIQGQLRRLEEKIGFQQMDRATVNGFSMERYQYVLYNQYFIYCQENLKPYVDPPYVDPETQQMKVTIAAPVLKEGLFDGIVYGLMDANFLSDIAAEASIGEGSSAFILDKRGTIIGHPDPLKVVVRENVMQTKTDENGQEQALTQQQLIYQKMLEGEAGFQNYTLDGQQSYLAYAPIPNTDGWSIGVYIPADEFMGRITNNILITVAVILITMLISAFLSLWLARGIANPIAASAHRLEQLAAGDLQTPIVLHKTRDETATLSEAMQRTVRSLNAMIADITRNLDEMAKGNLNVSPAVEYKGDFEPIEQSLVQIADSLNTVLEEINQSADQVAGGAEQVSGGAQALSQGSTEQASSIQELSASIAEISDEIDTSATNAARASGISEQTTELVGRGNQYMEQMLQAMSEMNESATIIGHIIKTIDDIAFQTNILALNAAVEAARAGSAGRGFAVVADEVRNLAAKSAQAAQTTTAYIQQSIEAMENGVSLADETAQSLQAIVEITQQVSELIASISQASNDQAVSINQITQGVDQISAVVQTNSATAEQSAASSEELSSQAQMLKSLVGRFVFKEVGNTQFEEVELEWEAVEEPEPSEI